MHKGSLMESQTHICCNLKEFHLSKVETGLYIITMENKMDIKKIMRGHT